VGDLSSQVTGLFGHWRGLWIQVDVDEATELLDGEGVQADREWVEVDEVVGVWRQVEASVELVGPGVVLAGDLPDRALAFQQVVGPVPAHVAEGAEHAAGVADNEDRMVGHRGGGERARIPDLLDVADPLPGPGEHGVSFDIEPPRVGIGLRGQWHRTCRIRIPPPTDRGRIVVGGGAHRWQPRSRHPAGARGPLLTGAPFRKGLPACRRTRNLPWQPLRPVIGAGRSRSLEMVRGMKPGRSR